MREDDEDDRDDDQRSKEGEYPLEDGLKGYVRSNPLDDEDIYPYRRGDDPHLGYEHYDDAKPDRVKAELLNYREEDGDGNHN